MQRHACMVAIAMAVPTLGAQQPATLPTHGPLALTAQLRSFVVDVTVPFASPAALLVLEYNAQGGWTPVRRLPEAGPSWYEGTPARVTLQRRLGRTVVPSGTAMDLPVDPGLGCAAQGGVYLADTGQCSVGGSTALSLSLYRTPEPRNYTVAVLQMPRRTRAYIEAALRTIPRADPRRELEQVIMALSVDKEAGWAAFLVPRAADQLPGMRP